MNSGLFWDILNETLDITYASSFCSLIPIYIFGFTVCLPLNLCVNRLSELLCCGIMCFWITWNGTFICIQECYKCCEAFVCRDRYFAWLMIAIPLFFPIFCLFFSLVTVEYFRNVLLCSHAASLFSVLYWSLPGYTSPGKLHGYMVRPEGGWCYSMTHWLQSLHRFLRVTSSVLTLTWFFNLPLFFCFCHSGRISDPRMG